jgi:hypothetical protein
MLAARDRAAGTSARAALLRGDVAADPSSKEATGLAGSTGTPGAASKGAARTTATGPAPGSTSGRAAIPAVKAGPSTDVSSPGPSAPSPAAPGSPPAPDDGDTLSRLRDAKRRARER